MESLNIGNFRKVNESVSPERLQPDEVTLLENMRLDEPIGEASTRKGFSRYSLQVDTAGAINNIYDVVDKNGANYLISAIAGTVRKSLNGTGAFSTIKGSLTGSLKTRMANYGGKFFFTNGTDNLFYSELAASDVQNVKIQRPDVQLVTCVVDLTAPTVSGSDTYHYLLVYRLDNGQKSNVSLVLDPLIETLGAFKSVTFSDLPIPDPADTRITSKQIFRTKSNIADTYYLLANLDAATTSYIDTTADADLDTTETIEYLNTPDKANYIVVNSDRTILANLTKTYNNRVLPPPNVISTLVGNPADYTASYGAGSIEAGTYYYYVAYVTLADEESEPVFMFNHTFGAGSNSTTFYGGPLPYINRSTGFLDDNIKYYRYYRTKKNTTSPTYYIGQQTVNERIIAAFTDTLADASLTEVYPKSGHGSTEQGVLRSSIIYSNPFKPLEYPELNYIEIYPDDGGAISGIFDDDNGIVVFKEKSICKLFTNGDPSNWSVVKISENIGCDEPDSIFKYEKSYFFVYKKMPYVLDGGSVKPIGYDRKPTFDSVTTFLGATFWDKALWYVLAVYIVDTYYLLCYDTKLGGWYKFNVDKADCLSRKEFGTDAGKLLIGGDLYINQYNEAQTYDTDNQTETITHITPELRTKTYLFQDAFTTARLMFLFLNYERMITTTSGQAIFTITNPETAADKQLVDEDDTPIGGLTQAIYKVATDGMTGILKRAKKLYLSMTGQGIAKFYGAKLEYNTEEWNVTRKHNA